jgi:hypothetical protein
MDMNGKQVSVTKSNGGRCLGSGQIPGEDLAVASCLTRATPVVGTDRGPLIC